MLVDDLRTGMLVTHPALEDLGPVRVERIGRARGRKVPVWFSGPSGKRLGKVDVLTCDDRFEEAR
jgi:hypothetical protein